MNSQSSSTVRAKKLWYEKHPKNVCLSGCLPILTIATECARPRAQKRSKYHHIAAPEDGRTPFGKQPDMLERMHRRIGLICFFGLICLIGGAVASAELARTGPGNPVRITGVLRLPNGALQIGHST